MVSGIRKMYSEVYSWQQGTGEPSTHHAARPRVRRGGGAHDVPRLAPVRGRGDVGRGGRAPAAGLGQHVQRRAEGDAVPLEQEDGGQHEDGDDGDPDGDQDRDGAEGPGGVPAQPAAPLVLVGEEAAVLVTVAVQLLPDAVRLVPAARTSVIKNSTSFSNVFCLKIFLRKTLPSSKTFPSALISLKVCLPPVRPAVRGRAGHLGLAALAGLGVAVAPRGEHQREAVAVLLPADQSEVRIVVT